MDIIKEIQKFNEDKRLSKFSQKYERNSFLNSLAVSRRESSHSSFLAELLRENSFHELGTLPLQLFLETVLRRAVMQNTTLQEKLGQQVFFSSLKSAILSRNLSISDIDVNTEVVFQDKNNNSGRVDILISCRTRPLQRAEGKDVEFLNIILENKIYAKEKDEQTSKYYKHFNTFLKNKASDKVDVSSRKTGSRALYNLYVYLTPATPEEVDKLNQPECECKEFVQICYQDLLDYVIDPLLDANDLSDRGRFYLGEYRRSLGVSFDNIETADKKMIRWNTTIMAIGKNESDEVCKFWKDHSYLLSSAINEKNRSEDNEDSEDSCKRTYYEYKGQAFNMGRLVQAVIIDHLQEYKMSELNNIFSDVVGNIVSTKTNSSYFEETQDFPTKDAFKVRVFKQWTENGPYKFSDFCNKTKDLRWYKLKEYKERALSQEESMMLVDFYDKHSKLITSMMEIIRRSSCKEIKENVEAFIKRTTSHRDRTTYSVTLHANNKTIRNLSRGRLVLEVLQDYLVEINCTKQELINTFNISEKVLKKEGEKGITGFFSNESDWLKLEDGNFMLAVGWNTKNINEFIEASSSLLYDINISN